jgi:hypothetical protein
VSEAEWRAFLDDEVTPRFPHGLTVLNGAGQWQGEDDEIVQEQSKLVILLFRGRRPPRATPRSRRFGPPTRRRSSRNRC